jgi:hypothetical protein
MWERLPVGRPDRFSHGVRFKVLFQFVFFADISKCHIMRVSLQVWLFWVLKTKGVTAS